MKPSLFTIARIRSIFILLFILLTTTAAAAASVTLRWDPGGPATDGYRLFARKSGQAYDYSRPDWEGSGVTGTLNLLDGRTEYTIVVRAYKGPIAGGSVSSTPADGRPPGLQGLISPPRPRMAILMATASATIRRVAWSRPR
ncbi:MAG: hypothetical protein KFF68_00435 [Desulfosarcina sp.]|nr:hypothetical protein [Desulfosarcina sp.]